MLTQFDLGSDGFGYIRERLSWGKTLATNLLNLPLESGHTWAYLPENVDVAKSKRFTEGEVWPDATEWVTPYIAVVKRLPEIGVFISKYLGSSGHGYAIFENANAKSSDPWIINHRGPIFFHKTEVYHFLTSKDTDIGTVETVENDAASLWLCIAVLTSLSDGSPLCSGTEVTKTTLKTLAENAEHIIIEAYDSESYVVWSRHE